ncbi:MAG: phenylalanine--tRNA ligase subunit alpha [Candidatus Korarchaeota archaeon]|nr:phenylalanine--tRNA ligase subunit alpha [Candidatus Korarchaeota archaeon]
MGITEMEISLSKGEIELLMKLYSMGGKAKLDDLGIDKSRASAWANLLREKGLVEIKERRERCLILSDRGKRHLREGLPEEKLVFLLKERGGRALLEEVRARMDPEEINVALGEGRRKGIIKFEKSDEKIWLVLLREDIPEKHLLSEIASHPLKESDVDPEFLKSLRRRGLIEVEEKTDVEILLTDLGQAAARGEVKIMEEVGKLTRDLILTGEWKRRKLKVYDVKALPPVTYPGKPHPYVHFLEEVREILIGMGFVEVKSPIVEAEFWNFDVLFQAQDHPAREVHDSYQVALPSQGADLSKHSDLVEKVRKTHEHGWETGSKGWGYKWSFDIARRLILRSQTTAASARTLAGGLEIPSKIFAIDKVFRPETPDRTHAIEFHQCEGVVLAEDMNVRHLMGFLAEFAKQLGFKEVKFKPAYFPFTEPSVEAYVKHEQLGWIEIAGSGLFRPEMLIPMGYGYPRVQALAWGIGIGRLAMIRLGLDDIRELHSQNLEYLRRASLVW